MCARGYGRRLGRFPRVRGRTAGTSAAPPVSDRDDGCRRARLPRCSEVAAELGRGSGIQRGNRQQSTVATGRITRTGSSADTAGSFRRPGHRGRGGPSARRASRSCAIQIDEWPARRPLGGSASRSARDIGSDQRHRALGPRCRAERRDSRRQGRRGWPGLRRWSQGGAPAPTERSVARTESIREITPAAGRDETPSWPREGIRQAREVGHR